MWLNLIKFLILGLISAILCWLPVTLWANEDAPKVVSLMIILLPAIALGSFLFFILTYRNNVFSNTSIKSIAIFILLSCVGWVSAMVASTVGIDFTFSNISQSPYELFITGLLPSMIGMLFIGVAIYISVKKSCLFSTVKIISMFIVASILGIAIFSITLGVLSETFSQVVSSLTGKPNNAVSESANILVLFLSWHIALYSIIPYVVRLEGEKESAE